MAGRAEPRDLWELAAGACERPLSEMVVGIVELSQGSETEWVVSRIEDMQESGQLFSFRFEVLFVASKWDAGC